jgi:hypothetical protein
MDRIALLSTLFLVLASPALAQRPVQPGPGFPSASTASSEYVDITSFGAKADGVTDCTPAIIAAVNSVLNAQPGKYIYFPHGPAPYAIQTPLVLPATNNGYRWIELYLDNPLYLFAPIIIPSYYTIHGHGGADYPPSFSAAPATQILVDIFGPAAIQIHSSFAILLENLAVIGVGGDPDLILIDGSSGNITLTNVVAEPEMDSSAYPLHIKGGFSINILGGVYNSPPLSLTPSIGIESDPNTCSLFGHFKFSDFVLINQGIKINLDHGCGVFAQLDLDDVLYEDGGSAALTTVGLEGSLNAGIFLKNISISDSSSTTTCLNNTGKAWNFQVFNCLTGGNQAITQGDPILDLEDWSLGSQPIGQSSDYVYHGMNGIVSTMPPTSTPAKAPPPLRNMNLPIPQWLRQGSRAHFSPPGSPFVTPMQNDAPNPTSSATPADAPTSTTVVVPNSPAPSDAHIDATHPETPTKTP